ncbi:MAG: hypothetical protein Q8R60_01775 [Mycobacteriales bacterium]|nr:hypothetical protein [Mycobacteriales bacterium]
MRRVAALTAASVAIVGTALPSVAAPKPKPITATYTATAATPDPTGGVASDYSLCGQTVPGSFDKRPFTVPAAGTLKVELSGYVNDWDLLLMDGAGKELAGSGSGGYAPAPAPEVVTVKFKKKTPVQIVACNWAGGPTGTVTYTFTYK